MNVWLEGKSKFNYYLNRILFEYNGIEKIINDSTVIL